MRRLSAFFLCLVLCLSLFPRYAFAAANDEVPTVIWSGYLENDYYGVLASAENRFDAAAVALGYNPILFSSEVRSKLSDVNYGGNFYKYATTFDEVSSVTDYPEWVPAYVSIGNIISDYWHFGTGFPPWKSRATNTLYINALVDLKLILAGEDLGGGGGSVPSPTGNFVGEYTELTVTAQARSVGTPRTFTAYNAELSDGYLVRGEGSVTGSSYSTSSQYISSGRVLLSATAVEYVNALVSSGYDVIVGLSLNGAVVVSGNNLGFQWNVNNWGPAYYIVGSNARYALFPNTVSGYLYNDDGLFGVIAYGQEFSFQSFSLPNTLDYYSSVITSPLPVPSHPSAPPSGTWPEPSTPVTPTAPELPEPATPTVETPVSPTVPAPVWPDITINIEPDPTPGTTPVGLDYTELLTRINDNLISIDSFARAVNSNLNSLRSDLLAEFNGVIGSLRNIYSYLLTIDSVLETHCTHLRNKMEESAVFIANYMRTLIKWLADQLDFDDLTNVEAPDNSLLTTINDKLGGGTYEPNPIKDEQGYYQWLDDLWDRFLLGDNWQSSMGSISGSFNELKTRFPFSIPWDVVALFRLFVHDPVTPVFDLPLYFSSDGSTPVHVDLTPWDSVAAVVRPLVFVIFALKLALLSRDLLGGLGADKGGL